MPRRGGPRSGETWWSDICPIRAPGAGLVQPQPQAYDRETMIAFLRTRGLATFALLVVVAEVVGRSLTARVDGRLHVEPLANSSASYYPFLLVGVKVAAALGLAALLARATRARAAADASERLLAALGQRHTPPGPRLRPGLSLRVWLGSF